jgi:hypothetical protein
MLDVGDVELVGSLAEYSGAHEASVGATTSRRVVGAVARVPRETTRLTNARSSG